MINENKNFNEKSLELFDDEKSAAYWMFEEELKGEDCTDNYRFAFVDDSVAMEKYDRLASGGCCGSFDKEIIVAGRLATIGCNYGH